MQNGQKLIASGNCRLPFQAKPTKEGQQRRLDYIKKKVGVFPSFMSGDSNFEDIESLEGNIESYIGMAMIPLGLAGPVSVKGDYCDGEYLIPMATSEGALLASYHRGIKAANMSGGITSICIEEGVSRTPTFQFKSVVQANQFASWVKNETHPFDEIIAGKSRYAQLKRVDTFVEGNYVTLRFDYHTGDASGQNMVTICTKEICAYILENMPVSSVSWILESSFSGDKKASRDSLLWTRGKRVVAEVILPRKVVERVLRTTIPSIEMAYKKVLFSNLQIGTIGVQGHIANGLAALFIATGQDVACVSEASVGITRMESIEGGEELYCSLTVPNLIVGTVGGGTSLPTQKECLEIMECYGSGKAHKFAEICTAALLGGELSIYAAMSAGHFSTAHQRYGRKTSQN